jgi:D-alanyl-D-alanine carboxypeptidase/Putative Flp pilus-assembly TadE/G-like
VSLVMAALTTLLSFGCAAFAVDVARITWERAQAQTAAEAAALAAVAESGPYGSGDPSLQARKFARANGAEVVECLCDQGATAMEVKVSLGRVTAAARAVLDPSLLRASSVAFSDAGLQPQLADAVRRLVGAAHGAVRVVSGFRSRQQQTMLWHQALARYGNPQVADQWVAPPGDSMHERGLAVDLGGDLHLALTLIDDLHLPMWRPLAHEPWHFELLGSRA